MKVLADLSHDIDSRKFAILYINGEILEGKTHAELLNNYLKDKGVQLNNEYYRTDVNRFLNNIDDENLKIAFAHFVDQDSCFVEEPGIYLETDTLRNVTKEEVVSVLKSKYMDHKFFDDNNYDNYGNYLLIAKKNKRLVKKCSRLKKNARVPTLSDFYTSYEYEYIDIGQQVVEVNKIVGISNGRNEEYNSDFTPIDENDTRWHYQKELVESGGKMEPIPLIRMIDGNYVGNGDGSHRISVAKVLGLDYVDAIVSVMIPSGEGIEDEWLKHSQEKRDKLNELSQLYKEKQKELNSAMEESFGLDKYEKILNELEEIGDEISNLDWEIIEEEKKFKQEIIQKYIN